jgi:hypothetical protein
MSEDDSERLEKVKAIFFQVQQALLGGKSGTTLFPSWTNSLLGTSDS